jgi:hypothetical protein
VSQRVHPQPMARRPTVTVVMPCYNYGHYLPTAVGSVLGQEGVDVDVILIDDASPDGSAAVVREFAARDSRIRPILHETNRGHIATYNEGLAQARGDYALLLSADDALPPGALARATALMEAHPSVGLVYGHPVTFSDDPPETSSKVSSWTVWAGREWIERRCRAGRNCIMNPEVVMRTSVQHEIGGYDPALPHSGDLAMWLRAASVSDIGRVNGPAQGFYRVHANSMQRTTYAGHAIDLEGVLDAFEKVLVEPGARVAGGEALFATAKQALAASAIDCARSAQDNGRGADEPVQDYLSFAARVWAPSAESRSWRTVAQRSCNRSVLPERGPALTARRAVERLRWRVRWQRWRWTGM